MRKAKIYMHEFFAGILTEDENGYHFVYEPSYLESAFAEPVSLSLPLSGNKFSSNVLFPFFDGLIPEGWLLEIAERNWKINPRDRMGILLATCRDCIGALSVEPFETE
jgi:serine/threonine-protein kinase HipA